MFAGRILDIEESAPVRILALVDEMRRRGREVISLAAGEPDFPTPKGVCEAAKSAIDEGHTHYTPSWGYPELREAIAEHISRENGVPCSGENVLVTPAKFAIFLSMLISVERGDEVIIASPSWMTYEACVRLTGARPVFVPTSDTRVMDVEGLKNAISPRTKMVVLNTPSNPTGAVLSRDDARAISDIVVDRGLYLLSDEVYAHMVYEGEHVSPASLVDDPSLVIVVGGFSKSWAMTGWRIGWLIGAKEFVHVANKAQQHTLTCVPGFVQKGALAALQDLGSVAGMVSEFRRRRDALLGLFGETPGIRCPAPKGAFYLFPSYDLDMDSLTFSEALLREEGVAVTPGVAFGRSCDRRIRISYANDMESLLEGCRRIKRFLSRGESAHLS